MPPCGRHVDRVIGTARTRDKAEAIAVNSEYGRRVEALVFDGRGPTPELASALEDSDAALVSVPPDGDGDPVLASVSEMLASAQKLERIAYLSTVGVYGDHGGAWIDEATEPRPVSTRSKARLAAEGAWQEFGARAECSIAILR